MRQVRILHICLITSGRPSEVFYGGEEKFTISLRNWLLNQGHNVTVVGRKLFGVTVTGSYDTLHVETGIEPVPPRVLRLPYPMYILCMLITSLFITLQVMSINRKSRISIIHAQDTGYGGLSAIMSAKILRVPVIISSHGVRHVILSKALNGISGRLSLLFEHWLDLITTKRADLMIAVSASVEEYFARLGVEKGKITTIPIGIEISKFKVSEEVREALREELGIQNDVVIGFVGRFSVEKNPFTLLEAFAEASRHADKMVLIFVGTGPVEGKLRMLSYDRGINDKIIFTGIRYDINRLLSAFDIFILPSYTEGCPTAMLEAMASGKAIIASDIPSIREIVRNGKEAILVNPYDAEELKRATLLLYNNPSLRIKLSRKARERAELYDVDRVYGQILNVYENLIYHKV